MTETDRLNSIWNDSLNTDDSILVRVLNTILDSGNENNETPDTIFNSIIYFMGCFDNLLQNSNNINRPKIWYVVDKIKYLEENTSFHNFIDLLNEVYKKNMEDYKYLFVLCYCRARFELYYADNICYSDPEYVIKQAFGGCEWTTFLEAFRNNAYKLM